jgi:hypothetical protein
MDRSGIMESRSLSCACPRHEGVGEEEMHSSTPFILGSR